MTYTLVRTVFAKITKNHSFLAKMDESGSIRGHARNRFLSRAIRFLSKPYDIFPYSFIHVIME